ncbi:VOC family protein [Pseudomonas sp. LD120]|uniref:VOC family protein n=1 Tax=Pseudomonas sp. LD120 TaxID=485751 RepID=UPI002114CC1E|nr:VOC family protein [Pseudomonas sp. LD120]
MLNQSTLCFATLAVPDLAAAEAFYVQVLGLQVSRRFAPTRWISLDVDEQGGAGLGLIEDPLMARPSPASMLDLMVSELDALVARMPPQVTLVEAPGPTLWGSYKAVIEDPFGNRLGLVQCSPQAAVRDTGQPGKNE